MTAQVEVRQFIERRPKVRHPYGASFMMLSQRGVAEIGERLADRTLGMQAMRVLLAMMSHMDFENRVDASQKELSITLNIDQSSLAKACKALIECGFIVRMANRRGWYRVAPQLCWKGSVRTLGEALKEKDRAAA